MSYRVGGVTKHIDELLTTADDACASRVGTASSTLAKASKVSTGDTSESVSRLKSFSFESIVRAHSCRFYLGKISHAHSGTPPPPAHTSSYRFFS